MTHWHDSQRSAPNIAEVIDVVLPSDVFDSNVVKETSWRHTWMTPEHWNVEQSLWGTSSEFTCDCKREIRVETLPGNVFNFLWNYSTLLSNSVTFHWLLVKVVLFRRCKGREVARTWLRPLPVPQFARDEDDFNNSQLCMLIRRIKSRSLAQNGPGRADNRRHEGNYTDLQRDC